MVRREPCSKKRKALQYIYTIHLLLTETRVLESDDVSSSPRHTNVRGLSMAELLGIRPGQGDT